MSTIIRTPRPADKREDSTRTRAARDESRRRRVVRAAIAKQGHR